MVNGCNNGHDYMTNQKRLTVMTPPCQETLKIIAVRQCQDTFTQSSQYTPITIVHINSSEKEENHDRVYSDVS